MATSGDRARSSHDGSAWCRITACDGPYDRAVLFPAVRHELSFWHGSSRLMGDLVLPAAGGPHPVVALVGEPLVTERDRSAWLDGLAAAGYACFTWDRPEPSGCRPDPVRQAAEHAREVLAALERLRCEPVVDSSAVALLGWGEGGWAAAQAATFSSRVKALVLAGTPTADPARLLEHRVIEHLRAAGHAGSDVAAARAAVRRRLTDVMAVGPGEWDGLGDAAGRAGALGEDLDRPWYTALQDVEAFTGVTAARLTADPLPTLTAVTVPVLALFGEQDSTLPLEESVRGIRDALRAAGHADHRVAVVRGGDHALRVRPGHGLGVLSAGRHQFGEWPPGLTAVLVEWLDARIHRLADVPAFAPPTDLWGAPGAGSGHPSVTDAPRRPARPGPLPVRQVRRRISR